MYLVYNSDVSRISHAKCSETFADFFLKKIIDIIVRFSSYPLTYKIDNLKSHNRQPNFFVICIYGRHKIRDKTSPTPHLILIPEQKSLIGYFHFNSSTKPVLKIKGLELFQEKKYLTGSFICLISKIHKYNRCCIHFGFKSSFTCKRKKIFDERYLKIKVRLEIQLSF